MKPWIAGVAGLLGFLVALTVMVKNPAVTLLDAEVLQPVDAFQQAEMLQSDPSLSTEGSALSGVWEGIGPGSLPTRLVVEDLHENWATVLYTWGDQPDGKFQKGWVRVRAKVLPGGRLFSRYPGNFIFQLSEDQTTLVGTREQAGNTATSLMRRIPSDVPLNLRADRID